MLEHPPQLWHNSQLSISAQILSMIIDNWQLLPTINLLASKIHSLNSVFSSSLGLNQPSLSASYLQERVNEGRGQCLGAWLKFCARTSRAIDLAPPSFKSWIRHWRHILERMPRSTTHFKRSAQQAIEPQVK